MTAKEVQSKSIEVLRFPMAVMVVMIHCYYFNTQSFNCSPTELGGVIVKWIINFLSIVITDCAVPIFYVISGYLYFIKIDEYTWGEYKDKIRKKLITLLLPYFVWNILGIIAYPMQFMGASFIDKILGFWSQRMEWGSWSGPWDGPLWFMRDLFVVMLFGPVISWLIKRIGILFPLALAVPYLIKLEALCPGFSSVSFFWFSVGSYLAIKRPEFSKAYNNKLIALIVIVLACICIVVRILTMAHIIIDSTGIIGKVWIFVSMNFYFLVAKKIAMKTTHFQVWKKLAASGFVIFAMHSLINGRISSVLLFLVGKENIGDFLTITFYLITILLTVFTCYIAHLIISKNKMAALFLEGGRS